MTFYGEYERIPQDILLDKATKRGLRNTNVRKTNKQETAVGFVIKGHIDI